jgi:hypothetical protein
MREITRFQISFSVVHFCRGLTRMTRMAQRLKIGNVPHSTADADRRSVVGVSRGRDDVVAFAYNAQRVGD